MREFRISSNRNWIFFLIALTAPVERKNHHSTRRWPLRGSPSQMGSVIRWFYGILCLVKDHGDKKQEQAGRNKRNREHFWTIPGRTEPMLYGNSLLLDHRIMEWTGRASSSPWEGTSLLNWVDQGPIHLGFGHFHAWNLRNSSGQQCQQTFGMQYLGCVIS